MYSLAVYEYISVKYILSHGKQVDGTEEEILHGEQTYHLQAQPGFLTSSLNGVK